MGSWQLERMGDFDSTQWRTDRKTDPRGTLHPNRPRDGQPDDRRRQLLRLGRHQADYQRNAGIRRWLMERAEQHLLHYRQRNARRDLHRPDRYCAKRRNLHSSGPHRACHFTDRPDLYRLHLFLANQGMGRTEQHLFGNGHRNTNRHLPALGRYDGRKQLLQRCDATSLEPNSRCLLRLHIQLAERRVERAKLDLFNQRDMPQALYGRQIAFNLLSGDAGPATAGLLAATARDLGALLGDHAAPTDLQVTWVPVFFGSAATLWVETSEKLDQTRLRELLRVAPGLILTDPAGADGTTPTPVEHALDSDAVHVALLGEDGASPRGQVLWLVADDVRRGRALNAVRVAECLMRDSEIG